MDEFGTKLSSMFEKLIFLALFMKVDVYSVRRVSSGWRNTGSIHFDKVGDAIENGSLPGQWQCIDLAPASTIISFIKGHGSHSQRIAKTLQTICRA